MTHEARIRRIGWIAILAVCAALYAGLHLKVQSVKSELVHAERAIVRLEERKLLLETEFLTRSSQLQLAQWNRVDFGYRPPEAGQFIHGERQLAMLGTAAPGRVAPAAPGAGPDIQLASYSPDEEAPAAEAPVSRLTRKPVDVALLAPDAAPPAAPRLALVMPQGGSTRIQLSALAEVAAR